MRHWLLGKQLFIVLCCASLCVFMWGRTTVSHCCCCWDSIWAQMEIREIIEEIESRWKKGEGMGVKEASIWNVSGTFNDPRLLIVLLSTTWMCLCCSIFPSPEQNPGLSHYQGLMNSGGSLPDLSNLHFPSPLSTPLDPEDNGGYPNLSGGSSTGNLPAAMMHLGIGNSQGGWSSALRGCTVSECVCFPPS